MVRLTSGMEYANGDTLILVFSFGSLMVSCSNCLRCKLEFGVNIMYTEADRLLILLLFLLLDVWGGSKVTDTSALGLNR